MGRRACGQLSRLQKAGSGDKLWDSRKVTVYGTFGLAAYVVAPLVAVWGQPQISPSVTTVGSRLSGDSLWDAFKVTVYGTKAAPSSQKQSPEGRHSRLTVDGPGARRA